MSAQRLLCIAEAYRRVEDIVEILPDVEMAGRRLAFARDLIHLLHQLIVEGAGLTHAVRLLEVLDGADGGFAHGAVEILWRQISHRGKDLLHANDAITLGPPGQQDAQRRARA